jgi:hypothetical protein
MIHYGKEDNIEENYIGSIKDGSYMWHIMEDKP